MTVAELIAALQALPPERVVYAEHDGALFEVERARATTPIAARIAAGRHAHTDEPVVILS